MPNESNLLASFSLRYLILSWLLLFLICLGLGYPTLNRYDPRASEGLSDTALYYQAVVSSPQELQRKYMPMRILVPLVAKPFYWLATRYLPNWDPVFFGLLVANSIFCAGAACFLLAIGFQLVGDASISWLAATLYLLNFAISNLQLAGLVDSVEACFMLALTWILLSGKWFILPLVGLLGTFGKETFVPFAALFSLTWWLTEKLNGIQRRFGGLWIAISIATSVISLVMLHSALSGTMVWPWTITSQAYANVNILLALWRSISNHGFWYIFGWLLPLGLWRIRSLPRPWVIASLVTAALALFLGAWKDMQGTAARPLFDVSGGILSLSTALLLSRKTQNQPTSPPIGTS